MNRMTKQLPSMSPAGKCRGSASVPSSTATKRAAAESITGSPQD
jgi:hypothetical protein